MARFSSAVVGRRPVLLAGMVALAVPTLGGALAGCTEKPPDPLVALLVQARSDAALADAAAQALRSGSSTPGAGSRSAAPGSGGPPGSGPGSGSGSGSGSADGAKAEVLAALAAARRAHAGAIAAELGDDAPPPAPAGQPGPAGPRAADAVAVVLTALDEARGRAAAEVPGLPRHRASLVGSIAACCAGYRTALG